MKVASTALIVTALVSFNAMAERQSGREHDRMNETVEYSMNEQMKEKPTAAGTQMNKPEYEPNLSDRAYERRLRKDGGNI